MFKFTLLLTQKCNLRCSYCYIKKRDTTMSPEVAARIVDLMFRTTPPDETLDIGFFGGEPLLEFELLKAIVAQIKSHPSYPGRPVVLSVVTNGTLLTKPIAQMLNAEGIHLCISCDGPPGAQDRFRRFADGSSTSTAVERAIRYAAANVAGLRVNAVFRPETFRNLPDTVSYLVGLGVDQIYLNPDFTARWSSNDVADLPDAYSRVGQLYKEYHRARSPRFISLIDAKIAVILSGGYRPQDRCRMGSGEFAFSPAGHIFPCERLVGDGRANRHCIGTVPEALGSCGGCPTNLATVSVNPECRECSLRDYCMRWCGCSNFMASGHYDRVNGFLCASERAAITVAFEVFQELSQELKLGFLENIAASQHECGGDYQFGCRTDAAGASP